MTNLEILGILVFKKGSKIHIKKKNRGKFTEYCGGEVTQKCIDKAKKSRNPKLRKRATFAENARKWKHQNGGLLQRTLLVSKSPIPKWIEDIMRASNAGNIPTNLTAWITGNRNKNTGSRIIDYEGISMNKTKEKEITPNYDRNLIDTYLTGKSNDLVPVKNPKPITVNNTIWNEPQYLGNIYVGDKLYFPEHFIEYIQNYIDNKKLIAMEDNVPTGLYKKSNVGKTYDNVRKHNISFKVDDSGQIYADIFDKYNLDHKLIGSIIDYKYGHPFILRQRVPVEFVHPEDNPEGLQISRDYMLNINQKEHPMFYHLILHEY